MTADPADPADERRAFFPPSQSLAPENQRLTFAMIPDDRFEPGNFINRTSEMQNRIYNCYNYNYC